jgi:hypothetical protein
MIPLNAIDVNLSRKMSPPFRPSRYKMSLTQRRKERKEEQVPFFFALFAPLREAL